MTDDEIEKQSAREERRLKIGAAAIGGILLLSVFSAVASVANMETQPPEPPAPGFEQPYGMPTPKR